MLPQRQPNFKHRQIVRLSRLLNMYYSPAELAAEIDVSADTVYRCYTSSGCPYKRDEKDRIWIVGKAFARWAASIIEKKKRCKARRLADDEVWCFHCKQITKILSPVTKPVNLYLELLQGKCNQCGGQCNRARKAIPNNLEYKDCGND